MGTWLSRRPVVLDEVIRRDGLQAHTSLPQCASCLETVAMYRCIDCTARVLYCAPCITHRHDDIPLHRIEVQFRFVEWAFLTFLLGLEWRVFRADVSQRLGALLLSWPPAYSLLVIRLENPRNHRHQHEWNSPRERPILYVHGERGVGRELSPAFACGVVPRVF